MASASVQSPGESNLNEKQFAMVHSEPEKPLVYEPPDLHGRKHVEKITTEYRVREDGCLADRLQNEEFELHFGRNKLDNKILHMDVRTAKSIYLREVEDSGMLSKDELTNLCKDDAFIAEEIEKRMNENREMEVQSKTATEMQDEEFAIYLQAREKQKLDQERKARLQHRITQDREAAKRLQREFNSEAREEDEAILRGMSDVQIKNQPVDKKRLQELEVEQRRLEEERDRKIAIELQREEAEQYQRGKRERQFRRAQTERRHDDHSSERRRNVKPAESNGNQRSCTPPERRRNQKPTDRVDSSSCRNRPVGEEAGRLVCTDTAIRNVNNNKKALQSVDACGRPVHDPANINIVEVTPRENERGEERLPPPEGIYLTAVDALDSVQATNNGAPTQTNSNSRNRTNSETKRSVQKQSSLTRTDSRDSEISNLDSPYRASQDKQNQPSKNNTNHRNIAADIDPTYSTINHFSQAKREGDIRPAPVVQNVRRTTTLNDAEKKKKKWFSKKEKAK